MLKGVLLRVGARIVLDWTSWAAIALAVVLAHSGIRHLDADAALLSHYGDAVGMPRFAYVIGALQLMAAAALVWRRTRGGACAALGTVGAEQFDAFFRKYDFKLALEYGQGRAKTPVGAATVVRELAQYCRQTIRC